MNSRSFFLARRKALSEDFKKQASQHIVEKCAALLDARNPKIVALFCAMPDEPTILSLLSKKNSTFCVPKVLSGTEIEMRKITSLDDLQKGRFGIWEPNNSCAVIPPEELDLIFIPAVAIDTHGNRIGMGKGYYDRYLEKCVKAFKVGVVFGAQISKENFKPKAWDVPMGKVITEL